MHGALASVWHTDVRASIGASGSDTCLVSDPACYCFPPCIPAAHSLLPGVNAIMLAYSVYAGTLTPYMLEHRHRICWDTDTVHAGTLTPYILGH